MPSTIQEQNRFDGGMNAQLTPSTLAQNEVQTSTNVEFTLEPGAALCRRGSVFFGTSGGGQNVYAIYRNYTSTPIDNSPWYSIGSAIVSRGTFTLGSVTMASIGVNGGGSVGYVTSYKDYTYLAAGTKAYRDNGSVTYNWVIETPVAINAVAVTSSSFIGYNGTFTASEGTVTSAGGSPYVLSTCTTGTGTRITLTGTVGTNTNWDNPHTYIAGGLYYTGTKTATVGNYGVDYLLIGFNNPSSVVRVSRDVSIGDATFTNYWHTETTIDNIQSGIADPVSLFLAGQGQNDLATQLQASANIRVKPTRPLKPGGQNGPIGVISPITTGVMPWAVPRSDYQLVGTAASIGWSNVQAVRVTVECTDVQSMIAGGWITWGDSQSGLSDTNNGYTWYVTLTRVENGIPVAEGDPTVGTGPLRCQGAAGQLTILPYSGSSTSGANYYGLYRQGGALVDATLVDYFPITGTTTAAQFLSDGGYPDFVIANNALMTRSLWGTWSGAQAISESWNNRIWLGSGNALFWTAPGQPTAIQADSKTIISNSGDTIQSIIPWDRLVIVNQNSVFEMDGTVFEGANQDWILRRTGARRGSVSTRSTVKTPYGIVLLGYDGISLYYPGQGIDQELTWVMDKMGDAWRGTGTSDPASVKNNRIPAFNPSSMNNSFGIYAEGKVYLAVPTTGATYPSDLFVLDLQHKLIQHFSYAFTLTSLYWDAVQNRVIAGTDQGTLIQLETGLSDYNDTAIRWNFTTRAWTTPQDVVVENLSTEIIAGHGQVVGNAIIDNGTVTPLGTFTNTVKAWLPSSGLGTIGNNIYFSYAGTQTNSGTIQQGVYGVDWTGQVQPIRIQFARSEFDGAATKEAEKIWDVHFAEMQIIPPTGTVTGVTFLDNFAILTNTYSMTGGVAGNGPVLFDNSFPTETYGNVSYSTYTSTGTTSFKLYNSYNTYRPEPPRINSFVTDRFSPKSVSLGVEGWWKDVLVDINCLGTNVIAIVNLDTTVVGTYTMTGSGRRVYNFALPSETYGNVMWVQLQSISAIGVFKHYQTWYNYSEEPTRALFFESSNITIPTESYVKTWVPEINPLGGVVTGTILLDGNVVGTQTITGSVRKKWEFGLPNITVGKTIKSLFSSLSPFKYWPRAEAEWELEQKPFNKTTWLVTYKKLGGVTQIDLARFFAMDIEGPVNSTLTNTWILDGSAFTTNTFTLSQVNAGESNNTARMYNDQIPFPPGARGYLFQQQITSTTPFKVWRSNIDIDRIGVKGLSRVTLEGTPRQG